MAKQHLYWIDWMKAIGMYFIIAGHIFPIGNEYIYVFSVPLFFIMSGFLSHREDDVRLFWKKLWSNLILPCIIICLILHLEKISASVRLRHFEWWTIPMHIFNCLVGFHGKGTAAGGIGVCWFIYTLVLCKLLQQFTSKSPVVHAVVISICIIVAVWYNYNELHLINAIYNTSLAYPMFVIGGVGKYLKIDHINKIPLSYLILFFITGLLMVIGIEWYNGAPMMFDATYGNNIILFFIGGIAGTVSVYAVSFMLRNVKSKVIDTIAVGNILILGLHPILIRAYHLLPKSLQTVYMDYFVALVILLAFIPIIRITERYFPVILGLRVKTRITLP